MGERPEDAGEPADERGSWRARVESIFSHSLDAIVVADGRGTVLEWNPSAERVFGWRADEIVGRSLAETVVPPSLRRTFERSLALFAARHGRRIVDRLVEVRVRRKDGSPVDVELTIAPATSGDTPIWTAFARDVTSRKAAEEEARRARAELEARVRERTAELETANVRIAERERRLGLLVDHAGDGIFLMDGEGRLLEVNGRGCAMLGYTRAELLGMSLPDIETAADPTQPIGPRLASLPLGEVMTASGMQRRKDGTTCPVEVRVGPVMHEGERTYLSLVRDVTEQRAMQRALALARDAAVEASRLKSDFLANMSHEIRTPLNGIMGMTGLLLDTELTPGQREDLEIVRQSGEHLLALINDILDLARIEAGRFQLEPTVFQLEHMIEEVANVLTARAEAKGLELVLRISPDAPVAVRADRVRLRQVLVNLAGNAVKFTDRGHVLLEVDGTDDGDGEAELRFSVTDTGVGLSTEDLGRIFEKFTQVDSSARRRHGGSGLGLTISRQLIEAMGGRIEARSVPGEGSTFSFSVRLPVVESPAHSLAATSLPVGLRTLVVDDSAVNRRVLVELAGRWRLDPTPAADAASAFRMLAEAGQAGEPFALALVDDQMPFETGLDLARRIRALPPASRPEVLLLSSVGRQLDGHTLAEAGVARWLTKPVGPSELLDAVLTVLGRTGFADETAPPTDRIDEAGSGLHVLLAEDTAVNREVATRMLARAGCTVDVAEDGSQAVRLAAEGRYDLILMDVQMPNLDGLEATARIREMERGRPRTPIVAMTAHAMAGDRERCLQAGMDGHLAKPVRAEDIARLLRQHATVDVPQPPPPAPVETDEAPEPYSHIDADTLLRNLSGDRRLLAELVDLLEAQLGAQLTRLREAVRGGNAPAVVEIAHAIKGSLASLHAGEASRSAHALEHAGRDGTLGGAQALLDDLEIRLGHARRDLARLAGRHAGAAPAGESGA